MRRFACLCAIAAVVVALAAGTGTAAKKAVFHSHENFTDTFPDQFCDIEGTSVVRGVDNFTVYSNNTVKDTFEVNQTFTSTATGKSIVIHVAEQFTGNDDPIDNGDGTVSFVGTFKGLPEQIRLKNGRLLSRDAGNVTFTRVFDATTGDLISMTVNSEKGPHPDLDSNFEIFCDVIVPALS